MEKHCYKSVVCNTVFSTNIFQDPYTSRHHIWKTPILRTSWEVNIISSRDAVPYYSLPGFKDYETFIAMDIPTWKENKNQTSKHCSLTFNTWQQHCINVSRSITCSTTSEATTASNVSAVSSIISSREHALYSILFSKTGSNDLWHCAVLMFSSTGSIPVTEAPSRPRG